MENLRLTLCPCFVSTISTTSALALWKCWRISLGSALTAAGSLYRIIRLPNTQRAVSADLICSHWMQKLCKKNSREVSTEKSLWLWVLEEEFILSVATKWWGNCAYMISGSWENACKWIQKYNHININYNHYSMSNKKIIKLSSTDFSLYLTPVGAESDHVRLMGFASLNYRLEHM